ncbi:MAG: hypothetical protein BIFFINMI_04137 [Phycisphaerae bacterium]|nr:hypothetical protein [Phycisphaerae bacterium]
MAETDRSGPPLASHDRRTPGERVRLTVNSIFVVVLVATIVPCVWLLLTDPQANPARAPDKVYLRYMFWGGPEQLDQARQVVAAFKDQPGNANIEVELIGTNRFATKLAAMMSSHEAPDVFLIAPVSIPKFADRADPLLVEITDYVLRERADMDFDDINADAVKSFYCNGRLFGLPRDYKTTGMAYNADMLAAAGLEDPNDLYDRNEWTWEKLLEYLQKLTGRQDVAGRGAFVFGLFQDNFSEGYWHNILLQAGGGIWSDDNHEMIIDRPESIRGLQFVYDLAWKHKVAKPWTPERGTDDPWAARQTAMMGFRGWHISTYIRQTYSEKDQGYRFAWDVCPWPMGPQLPGRPDAVRDGAGRLIGYRIPSGRVVTPATVHFEKSADGTDCYRLRGCTATGIGYAMSTDTRHREESWKLQRFLVSPLAQRIRARFDVIYTISGRRDSYVIPGPNMPSRGKEVQAYLDMAMPPGHPLRPTFTGSLAGRNALPRWPNIRLFIDARAYGRPAGGALGQDTLDRELSDSFQAMLLDPTCTPEKVAADARKAADRVYRRLRESPFRSSFNDPSLVRPREQDPLGMAP